MARRFWLTFRQKPAVSWCGYYPEIGLGSKFHLTTRVVDVSLVEANSAGARGVKMKVKPSVKKRCEKCQIIVRKGRVRVICVVAKHKQIQG